MINCNIYPIPLVEYISDKSTSTARCNIGHKITKICYSWYIEGSSHNILVDTGSIAANYHQRSVPSAKDIQTIDDGLKKIGRRVEDIEYVILTHLHPDHVALASRFTNATFIVQQNEYEVGLKPHPSIEWYYIREYFENLNVSLIDGDIEVAKNVSVLSTPGHSSGGQSVKVNTGKGNIVISGICSIYENFFPSKEKYSGKEVLIPGLYLNQFEVFESLLKIKRNADLVIANHDNRYKEIYCIQI